MNKAKRNTAAVGAAVRMVAAMPARAGDQNANILYGLLLAVGVSMGIVAYQTDYHKEPELKVHDETKDGKKKDGARIEIVPPPASSDESRPAEVAAAVAFCARF